MPPTIRFSGFSGAPKGVGLVALARPDTMLKGALLRLAATSPKELDDRLLYAGKSGDVEVFKASGAVRYTRNVERDSEPTDSGKLPHERSALVEAAAAVSAFGYTDRRASVAYVDHTMAVHEKGGRAEAPVAIEVHVNYRYQLADHAVVGPGAKMQVSFDTDGALSRFFCFFRPLAEKSEVSRREVVSTAELQRALADDPAWAKVSEKATLDFSPISVGYYAAPPSVEQRWLVPVYVVRGRLQGGRHSWEFTRFVPAVTLTEEEWRKLGPDVRELLG